MFAIALLPPVGFAIYLGNQMQKLNNLIEFGHVSTKSCQETNKNHLNIVKLALKSFFIITLIVG